MGKKPNKIPKKKITLLFRQLSAPRSWIRSSPIACLMCGAVRPSATVVCSHFHFSFWPISLDWTGLDWTATLVRRERINKSFTISVSCHDHRCSHPSVLVSHPHITNNLCLAVRIDYQFSLDLQSTPINCWLRFVSLLPLSATLNRSAPHLFGFKSKPSQPWANPFRPHPNYITKLAPSSILLL